MLVPIEDVVDIAVSPDAPRTIDERSTLPRKHLDCNEGDPLCDFDAEVGQCTFRVGVCMNELSCSGP